MGARIGTAERFWAKVDKSGDCWLWTASCDRHGYGNVRIQQRLYRAHRIAYEMTVGPIPAGQLLLHSCDNPPCVNPAHLQPGTHTDNRVDMHSKGRGPDMRGERHSRVKLTELQVRAIRREVAAGASQRTVGKVYGISHTHVGCIVDGRSWSHVPLVGVIA